LLKIEQLSTQIGAYRAVDSVALEIKQGEFVSLIGASRSAGIWLWTQVIRKRQTKPY